MPRKRHDEGFTLIELLVVMIIIGILASIAIPVFLNQRKKANDTAARSDASMLGKEIVTYYVGSTSILAAGPLFTAGVAPAPSTYSVNGIGVGNASAVITGAALTYMAAPANVAEATDPSSGKYWCVTVTYAAGTLTKAYYSAKNGLSTVGC